MEITCPRYEDSVTIPPSEAASMILSLNSIELPCGPGHRRQIARTVGYHNPPVSCWISLAFRRATEFLIVAYIQQVLSLLFED